MGLNQISIYEEMVRYRMTLMRLLFASTGYMFLVIQQELALLMR